MRRRWILPFAALATGAALEDSPLAAIERMHRAMHDADAKTVDSLLHPNYQGLSFFGRKGERRKLFVDTRERAVSDVAKLKPGEWEIRFLRSETQIDPNGQAHVWARYVFLFKGAPDHCGFESYGLFKTPQGWQVISFADTDTPLEGKSVDEVCPDARIERANLP